MWQQKYFFKVTNFDNDYVQTSLVSSLTLLFTLTNKTIDQKYAQK